MSWEVTANREEKVDPEVATDAESSGYGERRKECSEDEEDDGVTMASFRFKTYFLRWSKHE